MEKEDGNVGGRRNASLALLMSKTWKCMLLWLVCRLLKEVDLIGMYVSWQRVTADREDVGVLLVLPMMLRSQDFLWDLFIDKSLNF